MTGSPDDGAVPGRAAPDVPAVPDIPESAAGTGDASGAAPQRAAFRVDLRGMVDLLSRNLYSGPRVYVRELLQNAVDAIAARRALEPGCPGRISIELSRVDGVAALRCADTGIGLTPEQAAGLLSTVGASSKRDELGLARGDYLGQFGIGLLSCFMVSPEIIVTSRSARGSQSAPADPADPPDPPGRTGATGSAERASRIGASAPPGAGGAPGPTVTWAGRTNGTYAVSVVTDPADRLPEPGTVVELISLPGEHWLEPQTVRALVDEFGSLLPVEIEVRDGARVTRHGGGRGPWEMSRHEAIAWCAQELGVTPFDIIDLDVPASGLRGIAVVVTHAHPAAAAHHTAYVKRMLVSRAAEDLAPAWAYFVRVIAGSDHLRPTASRERLVDDEMLEATRRGVGDAVHGWLERTARLTPSRFADFLDAHAVGLRSVALRDEQVLALVARHLPVETTEGALTLTDLVELARPGRSPGPAEGGTIGRPGPAGATGPGSPGSPGSPVQGRPVRYTRTVDQYRALADVASSQGLVLVNAGYSFEEEVLTAFLSRPDLAGADPGIALVDPGELLEVFTPCAPGEQAEAVDLLVVAATAIDPEDCEVVLRRFEPASLPALYLPDPDLAGRVAARSSARAASGAWAEVLGVTDPFAASNAPRLVLNRTSSLVMRLVAAAARAGGARDDTVVQVLRGLYIQCLLAGRQPLGAKERAWASQALSSLLDVALSARGPGASPEGTAS